MSAAGRILGAFLIFCLGLTKANVVKKYATHHLKYSGRISVGIPELKNEAAASAVRWTLAVQFENDRIHFQMTDIEVAEFRGDFGCRPTSSALPAQFRAIQEELGRHLALPFSLKLDKGKISEMYVPTSDKEWMTNLRKSVVSNVLIQPFLKSGDPEREVRSFSPDVAFPVMEETVFGLCESRYTILPLGEAELYFNGIDPKESSSHENKTRFWKAIRTINFDNCRAAFWKSPGASTKPECVLEGSQCLNLHSRSSKGEYILADGENGLVVARATIEGVVGAMPYGYTTETVTSLTTVELELVRVSYTEAVLANATPMKTLKNVAHEFLVNSQDNLMAGELSRNTISLEEILFGEEMKESDRRTAMDLAVAKISEGVKKVLSKKEDREEFPSVLFLQASLVMRKFSEEEIEEVYESVLSSLGVNEDDLEVGRAFMFDTTAASGTREALRFVLKKFKEDKVGPFRLTSILLMLSKNAVDPTLIQDVMDLCLKADEHGSGLVEMSSCLSVGALNRKLCTPAQGGSNGDCATGIISSRFVPEIEKKLQGSLRVWKKILYIQALSSLGTAESLRILKEVASGGLDADLEVRKVALLGLRGGHRVSKSLKSHVDGFLMTIFSNIAEDVYLRELSLLVAYTWTPDASWWHQVALSTWHEPSSRLRSFVVSFLHTVSRIDDPKFSELSRYARHVLPLARKVSPSLLFPGIIIFSRSDLREDTSTYKLLQLLGSSNFLLHDVSSQMDLNFGGIEVLDFQFSVKTDYFRPLYEIFGFPSRWPLGQFDVRRTKTYGVMKELNMSYEFMGSNAFHSYIKFFEDVEIFLSQDLFDDSEEFQSLAIYDLRKANLMSTFVNTISWAFAVPTELGTPLLMERFLPGIYFNQGRFEASTFFYQFGSAHFVRAEFALVFGMRTPVPWSGKVLSGSLANRQCASLPFITRLLDDTKDQISAVGLEYVFDIDEKHSVLYARNEPAVSLTTPESATIPIRSKSDVIRTRNRNYDRQMHVLKAFTGMNFTLSWKGDHEHPFSFSTIVDFAKQFPSSLTSLISPTTSYWETSVDFHPETSVSSGPQLWIYSFIGGY